MKWDLVFRTRFQADVIKISLQHWRKSCRRSMTSGGLRNRGGSNEVFRFRPHEKSCRFKLGYGSFAPFWEAFPGGKDPD